MSSSPHSSPPSPSVLNAFSCTGPTTPLVGGQNQSHLGNSSSGHIVLKPIPRMSISIAEFESTSHILNQLPPNSAFCVPRPVTTTSGSYTYDFWIAAEFLPGYHNGPQGRWAQLLTASRAFHYTLRGFTRPTWLRDQTHAWAVADRVAWGERAAEPVAPSAGHILKAAFDRLIHLRRAVDGYMNQLVHGDLCGNVMFAEQTGELHEDIKPPAIIDFSPFWRPVEYAEAIVVADGMLWFGGGTELIDLVGKDPMRLQMLIRALLFRLVASNILSTERGMNVDEREVVKFDMAVDIVEELYEEDVLNKQPTRSS